MNIATKVMGLAKNVKLHWRVPAQGRYMTYKEIMAYSCGGIGVYFVVDVVNKMMLSTSNVLIGNTIGISPNVMYVLYILGVLSSFPLTALRANIIDNTRGKKGKYRPYIMRMGIPCALLSIAFVWFPYEDVSNFTKYGVILSINIGFQFFFAFFRESYENLIHVLSPNSQERTDVLAVKSVIYSLAPTIINAVVPILANKFFNDDMTDINLYRYVYPPITVVGILLAVIVYVNTQEKVIQAKTHIVKVKFLDAFRAVAKNKYFWIISLAGWLGFLESFYANILYWLYQYQKACTGKQYSLIVTIYGNGSLWGMLLAPPAIRKFGKKKVLVVTNLCNIIFLALLYPAMSNIWLVLIILYVNATAGAFAHVLDPAIQGDIRDYQQYITGERIDGMFSAVGLIGSVVSLITSGVLPAVYTKHGIFEGNGLENMYDILYDADVFQSLMAALILFSVFGAVMNVLPYFFYDLTETKQKAIVRILKIRAFFEDKASGVESTENAEETMQIITSAKELSGEAPREITKQLKKQSSDEYSAAKKRNEEIEIAKFVTEEIEKFANPEYCAKLQLAGKVYAMGLDGFTNVYDGELEAAKSLPNNTAEERAIRKYAIALVKARISSNKKINKHFSGKITKFDDSIFTELFNKEDQSDEALEKAYRALYEAKDKKDKPAIADAKAKVNLIKQERALLRTEIKKTTDSSSLYYRTAKPWLDCKKLTEQAQCYANAIATTSV